jgi:hypothetical protein
MLSLAVRRWNGPARSMYATKVRSLRVHSATNSGRCVARRLIEATMAISGVRAPTGRATRVRSVRAGRLRPPAKRRVPSCRARLHDLPQWLQDALTTPNAVTTNRTHPPGHAIALRAASDASPFACERGRHALPDRHHHRRACCRRRTMGPQQRAVLCGGPSCEYHRVMWHVRST